MVNTIENPVGQQAYDNELNKAFTTVIENPIPVTTEQNTESTIAQDNPPVPNATDAEQSVTT